MFTLLFGDYTFPNQTFEVDGFDLKNKIGRNSIPRRHGSIIQKPYLDSRVFRVRGKIHNNVEATSHAQLLALQAGLLNGEQKFFCRSGWYIKAYAADIKSQYVLGTDKAVVDVDISMAAQVPFFVADGATNNDVTAASGTTTSFEVFSGGNVFSEPVISFYANGGTISDNIQLTNQTNENQIMRFRGTVANGTTLQVNTEDLTMLVNGVDGISWLEGDFISLLAGTNTFEFVGSDCQITVGHKYRRSN